jgi:hypothetical protein
VGAELSADETHRDLAEKAGAVTRAVGGPSPAMVQPLQTLDGQAGDSMGAHPVKGREEPDAAGVTRRARVKERCRHHSLDWGSEEV